MSGSGKTGGIADTWRSGYIPLQDHGSKTEGTTIRTRNMRHAVRLVDRLNDEGILGMGHYAVGVFESGRQQYGDIIGGLIWENELVEVSGRSRSASLRETAAWAFAWPATITEARRGRKPKARPVHSEDFEQDDRFVPMEVVSPVPVGKGRKGIVLDSVREDKQEQLFFPVDSLLIAHWRGLDPNDLSSLVFDIDAEGEPDKERLAPLDSAWRVSKLVVPRGDRSSTAGTRDKDGRLIAPVTTEQGLAWNLDASPGVKNYGLCVGRSVDARGAARVEITTSGPPAGTRGSFGDTFEVSDPPDKYDGVALDVGGLVLGHMGTLRGGPLYCGAGREDKHYHGDNPDGEPICAGHIGINTCFFATPEFDAPLEWRLEAYPDASILPQTVEVHLSYHAAAEHPWIAGPGDIRSAPGLWRWYSYSIVDEPDDGGGGDDSGGGNRSGQPAGPQGGRGGGLGGPGAGQGGAAGGNAGGLAVPRIPPHIEEQLALADAKRANQRRPVAQAKGAESINEICGPAYSFRPQRVHDGQDHRYAKRISPDQREQLIAPVTMRLDAFGGADPGGEWLTTRTDPDARYRAGTGPGGLCYLPPELGIEDIATGVTTDANQGDISTTHAVLANVQLTFADGINLETATPVDGYSFRRSGALADLEIVALDPGGAETPAANVTPAGVVRFRQATEHPILLESSGGPFTLDATHHTLLVDNSTGGGFTLNLPPAGPDTQGRVYQIKRVNAGGAGRRINITPSGGDTIDGSAAAYRLNTQWDSVVLKSDGASNWYVF